VKSAVDLIRNNHPHVKLKINTVVFKYNWKEDMHGLIEELKPDRWKVFQVKLIENVNDEAFNLGITKDLFMDFVKRHENLNPIWEDNDLMTDSYIMIDPQGRFFNDNDCLNNPRKSILEVGVRKAFDGIRFNYKKFLKRGGYYRW